MADGMNHVRAIRLAEILQEFRNLQHSLQQIALPPEDARGEGSGYNLLRQCYQEGQELLNAPYNTPAPPPNGDPEKEKSQLRQVILDAAARRFKAHCIYLRAAAAMRWITARNNIQNGRGGGASQGRALQAVDSDLSKELRAITAEKIRDDLRSQDQRDGRWIDEDPNIAAIRAHLDSLT